MEARIGMITQNNSWEEKLMQSHSEIWAGKCMQRPLEYCSLRGHLALWGKQTVAKRMWKSFPLIFGSAESSKMFPSSSSSSAVLRGLCRQRQGELRLWSYTYFQSHYQLTKHNLCLCMNGKQFCKELVPASIPPVPQRSSSHPEAISRKKADDVSHFSSR